MQSEDPNEDCTLDLTSEESSLMSEDLTFPNESCTIQSDDPTLPSEVSEDPTSLLFTLPTEEPTLQSKDTTEIEETTLQSEGMTVSSKDPIFLSEEYTATDSSEKSSVIAPSISPLHSYSCGSPTPSPSPSPSLEVFESQEAAAACALLDVVEPTIHSQADDEKPVERWCGVKLVIDNVDFNITPSFQRVNKVKKSLHYVQTYGVKDRVDLSSLSNEPPRNRKRDANDLMPSPQDIASLKEDFCILLSR